MNSSLFPDVHIEIGAYEVYFHRRVRYDGIVNLTFHEDKKPLAQTE